MHFHQAFLFHYLTNTTVTIAFFPFLSGDREDSDDKKVVAEIMARCFFPALVTTIPWEGFHFVGHEIRITEAMDCYGAVVWPSV